MSGRNGLPEGRPYVYQGSGTELSPSEVKAKLCAKNGRQALKSPAEATVNDKLGRDEAAARVSASLPGAAARSDADDLDGVVTRKPGPPGEPLACFARHLQARMRALGWDAARLTELTGVTQITITKAVNGSSVSLEFAGKLAALTGLTLPQMLGPYTCGTCTGTPPAGFACLECGTEGDRK